MDSGRLLVDFPGVEYPTDNFHPHRFFFFLHFFFLGKKEKEKKKELPLLFAYGMKQKKR